MMPWRICCVRAGTAAWAYSDSPSIVLPGDGGPWCQLDSASRWADSSDASLHFHLMTGGISLYIFCRATGTHCCSQCNLLEQRDRATDMPTHDSYSVGPDVGGLARSVPVRLVGQRFKAGLTSQAADRHARVTVGEVTDTSTPVILLGRQLAPTCVAELRRERIGWLMRTSVALLISRRSRATAP